MRTADPRDLVHIAFRTWCAEELVDPRLEDILEDAFTAGFLARDKLQMAPMEPTNGLDARP